jgi:hypothetical protein
MPTVKWKLKNSKSCEGCPKLKPEWWGGWGDGSLNYGCLQGYNWKSNKAKEASERPKKCIKELGD